MDMVQRISNRLDGDVLYIGVRQDVNGLFQLQRHGIGKRGRRAVGLVNFVRQITGMLARFHGRFIRFAFGAAQGRFCHGGHQSALYAAAHRLLFRGLFFALFRLPFNQEPKIVGHGHRLSLVFVRGKGVLLLRWDTAKITKLMRI